MCRQAFQLNLSICRMAGPLAVLVVGLTTHQAAAYDRYNSGCQSCHGAFTDETSPKGTIFPANSKHEMHRSASYMNTECNLCHTSGDQKNPFIGSSNGTSNNPGVGCTGCHGRDYGGVVGNSGVGLRLHHAINGVTECATCHDGSVVPADPPPLPESVMPTYYGTVDTLANNPCNPDPTFGVNENWTIGDTLGTDNDGDNLYDTSDPDCSACSDLDGDGVTDCDGDCDDNDPAVFPGAPELCDGIDNDCDSVVPATETDDDGDGLAECEGDCDDTNPAVYPGAPELCDGIDNDCDGVVPPNEFDSDGDGVPDCLDNCPSYNNPTQDYSRSDLDYDCDVDANDFLTFSNCFNGSLNPPKAICANLNADLDTDGDVDANDFLTFSNCFNGALNPPRPGCL